MNIDKLIQILQNEYEIYQKLYQLSEEKQEIIIDNKVDDLLRIIEDEQEEIKKIDKMEAERIEFLKGIAKDNSLDEGELSFAKLMEMISNPSKSELKNIRQEILDLLGELRDINEINANLIRESLKLNDYTLQLLTESNISKIRTYQKPGDENQGNDQKRSIIDHKA
jgi:flagellar biosynthesis/type III secretory pathway chaperone